MEQPNTPQDYAADVPLSSSPVPSTGTASEIETDDLGKADLVPSPLPATPRSSTTLLEAPSHEASYMASGSLEKSSNLPLLSPFAVIKNEPLVTSEDLVARSVAFQPSLDSLASSLSDPPLSSEVSSSSSPRISDILQSPFGANLKNPSALSTDLFLSSSNCSSSPDVSTVSNLVPVNYVCLETEVRKNITDLSDSGESTAGAPSTPKSLESTLAVASSSPYFVSDPVAKCVEEIVCADTDHVTKVDRRDIQVEQDLSHNSSQPSCSASFICGEPSSITVVRPQPMSPVDQASHASPINELSELSSPKDPSETTLLWPTNENTAQKRSREADEKEPVPAPAPKRMTLASQQKQHKKLASPFRSPLLSRPNPTNISPVDRGHTRASQPSPLASTLRQTSEDKPSTPPNHSTRPALATVPHPRTPLTNSLKAKAQFKSPFTTSSPKNSSSRASSTRNIQELERKVQVLKRAMKIKAEAEEEKLEQLVKKWRSAGREAAWELWQIVRDNEESSDAPYPGTNSKSSGTSISGSWGWAGKSGADQGSNWGWDESPVKATHEDSYQSEELESSTKLERELFDNLRRTSGVPRTSMLPPTPRGAYFKQRTVLEREEETGPDDTKDLEEEDHAANQPKSLGTMLHQLGIGHETLGWVEDEGDFVDT